MRRNAVKEKNKNAFIIGRKDTKRVEEFVEKEVDAHHMYLVEGQVQY